MSQASRSKVKSKAKSRVNEAGNYTKPELRKQIFNRIKAGSKGGAPGQWSARKAQMMAKEYKAKGGGATKTDAYGGSRCGFHPLIKWDKVVLNGLKSIPHQ